jgi:chaperonin cofactor prefoldin
VEGLWDVRHPAFDAHSYLFQVHADTSYHELAEGMESLGAYIKTLERSWQQSMVRSFPAYLTAMITLLPELGLTAQADDQKDTLEQLQRSTKELQSNISNLDQMHRELLSKTSAWYRELDELPGDPKIGLCCRQLLASVGNQDANAAALSYVALMELNASVQSESSNAHGLFARSRWSEVAQRWAENRLQHLRFGSCITGRPQESWMVPFWTAMDVEVERLWKERVHSPHATAKWRSVRFEVVVDTLITWSEALLCRVIEDIQRLCAATSRNNTGADALGNVEEPDAIDRDILRPISEVCLSLTFRSAVRMGRICAELWRYVDLVPKQPDVEQKGKDEVQPVERVVACLLQFRARLVESVLCTGLELHLSEGNDPSDAQSGAESLRKELGRILVKTLQSHGVSASWVDLIEE